MTTSLSLIRFPALRHTSAEINAKKAEEFQSLAQLVEDLIPNFKKEEERQFYREVGLVAVDNRLRPSTAEAAMTPPIIAPVTPSEATSCPVR